MKKIKRLIKKEITNYYDMEDEIASILADNIAEKLLEKGKLVLKK